MTTTDSEDLESSTDGSTDYDTDAAVAISRRRLADELDPREFGQARALDETLADLAAAVRRDDLTVAQLDAACVELELLYDALEDLSRLHGWGWEENPDEHDQPEPDQEPGAE